MTSDRNIWCEGNVDIVNVDIDIVWRCRIIDDHANVDANDDVDADVNEDLNKVANHVVCLIRFTDFTNQ